MIRDNIGPLQYNKKIHDLIASKYDKRHSEIFNPIEQKRINSAIKNAISEISTDSSSPLVLDFGSGTGNLTKHLVDLGANVVAADLSDASLEQLKVKLGGLQKYKTEQLNGRDLSNFTDNTFDMVATYSVLHHVPDYLSILGEFVRVVKPGGIIYIDHEVCPAYWEGNPSYLSYLGQLGRHVMINYSNKLGLKEQSSIDKALLKIRNMFSIQAWIDLISRNIFWPDSGASGEGDIHVHKDAHIEWDDIRKKLSPSCEFIEESDYLVCREKGKTTIWQQWQDRCADMRMLVARKKTSF